MNSTKRIAKGFILLTVLLASSIWLAGCDLAVQAEESNEHNEANHKDHQEGNSEDNTDNTEHDHANHAPGKHIGAIQKNARCTPGLDCNSNKEDHEGHNNEEDKNINHQKDAHDAHAEEVEGHESHEEDIVKLSNAQIEEFGIKVDTAQSGKLVQYVELPGEIVLNPDRMAHVVPWISGVVRKVTKNLGDEVKKGELMAIIESRELADAKAAYLAANERVRLAQSTFDRKDSLWKQKLSSEQEFLDARLGLAEARITRRSAKQQLLALGFEQADLRRLSSSKNSDLTRYEIRAPFSGTIIEKHITLGESLQSDAVVFTVADLSNVWVTINIYQKDLASVRKGQSVKIIFGHNLPDVAGNIEWVSPLVDEDTRTAKARVILDNPDKVLRPGLFVTARIEVSSEIVTLRIPKTAIQVVEGKTSVFVLENEAFKPRPVELGKKNGKYVAVSFGLNEGERYVRAGSFTLKAQMSKGAFGDGHNH